MKKQIDSEDSSAQDIIAEYESLVKDGVVFTEVRASTEERGGISKGLSEEIKEGNFTLPKGHRPFMGVSNGGSSCASCKYVDQKAGGCICTNKYYQKWEGTNKLPIDIDNYCSDWYEPK